MRLGLSTMTKNQGGRLKEWVLYHKELGHEKFIIFLDECTDNSEEMLKSLIDIGIDIDIHKTENFNESVLHLYWVDRSHKMYDFVLKNYSDLDWISFVEVDEFIFPQKKDLKFVEFLSSLKANCLYINSWDFKPPFDENKPILGQSYFVWSDEQRYNSKYRFRGKSIIKPKEFIKCVDAHHFIQKNNLVSNEFKAERNNLLQKNYGSEVVIDDFSFRIYHFRNHSDKNMNTYIKTIY
jgi:hypothetical protein